MHGTGEIAPGELGVGRALGKLASGFEGIGQVDDDVERPHRCSGYGMVADGAQNRLVLHAELVGSKLRAEARVEHDGVGALEVVDWHPALGALSE